MTPGLSNASGSSANTQAYHAQDYHWPADDLASHIVTDDVSHWAFQSNYNGLPGQPKSGAMDHGLATVYHHTGLSPGCSSTSDISDGLGSLGFETAIHQPLDMHALAYREFAHQGPAHFAPELLNEPHDVQVDNDMFGNSVNDMSSNLNPNGHLMQAFRPSLSHNNSVLSSGGPSPPPMWDGDDNFPRSQLSSPVYAEDVWNITPTMTSSNGYTVAQDVLDFSRMHSHNGLSETVLLDNVEHYDVETSSRPNYMEDFVESPTSDTRSGRRNSPESENTARGHPLYKDAKVGADGLYHCPWENNPNTQCTHKPEKLKCNYEYEFPCTFTVSTNT